MAMVLIVEDDTMNRDMLARRLSWEGYQVITAADGAQAVEIARAERPALILMDMGLPILDGWRATQQIRAMPEIAHIPIIALTAFALAEDRAKALAAGCNDYETKPIDFRRLLAKMRTLFDSIAER